MKKRIITVFSLLFFIMVSFCGCSNNAISKVEIIDNTIKTNYIIGEEFKLDNFSLKVTFTNNHEKIYNITQDMLTHSRVNNMTTDVQNINLSINYNGMNIDFIISVKYDLPQEIKSLNELINNLPIVENITFSDEETIDLINKIYSNLDKKYLPYVEGYENFLDAENELKILKSKYITPDFINKRFILKTNLDNFFSSLNKNDYSLINWSTLLRIYDESISALYLNDNHEKIDSIVVDAINSMKKVTTLAQDKLLELKAEKINEIIQILFTYDSNLYSVNNYYVLNSIVEDFIKDIDNTQSIEELNKFYNQSLNKLNNVETIEQEKISSLNYTKNVMLTALNECLSQIDLNLYTNENKNLILKLYDYYFTLIENANSENEATKEIENFNYDVSLVKTYSQEQKESLNKIIENTIKELTEFYKNIKVYEYDTSNRKLIESKINEAISDIKNQTNEENVYQLKNNVINYINSIPTMVEQSIINLPKRINSAKEKMDTYLVTFNEALYSKENWNLIINITNEYKEYFQNNITIYTSNIEINDIIKEYKNEINSIKTIEEEYNILLKETKNVAISELKSYFKSLDESEFLPKVYDYVKSRIDESIQTIETLDNISNINKLVANVIETIENIKK